MKWLKLIRLRKRLKAANLRLKEAEDANMRSVFPDGHRWLIMHRRYLERELDKLNKNNEQ